MPVVVEVNVVAEVDDEEMGISVCMRWCMYILLLLDVRVVIVNGIGPCKSIVEAVQ